MKRIIERILPKRVVAAILPAYHFALAALAALYYRFPSRRLTVIGITGTKGKTSTAELLNAIFEEAGKKTAVLGTLRFKVGEEDRRNLRKMTMPGRFFVQRFLSDAVKSGCTHAIVEMTSEGAVQFRQRFVDMDALIFTNLSPEHIESHGSYERYRDAKLAIARTLARSKKSHRYMVANADDVESEGFLSIEGLERRPYSIDDAEDLSASPDGSSFEWNGVKIVSGLSGIHNVYNALGAATAAAALGISDEDIAKGVASLERIPGRGERIDEGQGFPVVIDYAHTPDSLRAIYDAYEGYDRICVLGNTGGGRDRWKRPVMGEIAESACETVILTDEDPYDEDPLAILMEMKSGMKRSSPTIVLDRRSAIANALARAKEYANPAVIVTGKGTDPYIMGPKGTKTPWDDREVAKEELRKMGA